MPPAELGGLLPRNLNSGTATTLGVVATSPALHGAPEAVRSASSPESSPSPGRGDRSGAWEKARVEDAWNATRVAVGEGIVPGGGVALLRYVPALDEMKLEGDQGVGVSIVKRALEEPIRQIMVNAGVEGAVIVSFTRCRTRRRSPA